MLEEMQKLYLALLLFSGVLLAQNKPAPDCVIPFSFTAAAQVTVNNTCGSFMAQPSGVVTWALTYYSTGFSALSLVVQSAPDVNGTPGTWGTFTGTVAAGVNPNTAITQAYTLLTGFNPWVRVNLTSVTGSGKVTGQLYGWRAGPSGSGGGGGGGGGGAATPGVVGTPIPVNVSASGLTQILAASAGKTTTIYHLSLGFASGVNFQLEYGTGSNCGTGTTAFTGVYQAIAGIALDLDSLVTVAVPASQAVCVNLGAAVVGGGLLVYSQP
jgi:hypothetical protein